MGYCTIKYMMLIAYFTQNSRTDLILLYVLRCIAKLSKIQAKFIIFYPKGLL